MNKNEIETWLLDWLDDYYDSLSIPEDLTPDIIISILDIIKDSK